MDAYYFELFYCESTNTENEIDLSRKVYQTLKEVKGNNTYHRKFEKEKELSFLFIEGDTNLR